MLDFNKSIGLLQCNLKKLIFNRNVLVEFAGFPEVTALKDVLLLTVVISAVRAKVDPVSCHGKKKMNFVIFSCSV